MGMIGHFVAVSPGQLQQLIADPDSIQAFLYPDNGEALPNSLDVDKAWHGIHFLLTGDPDEGDPPLALAVLGGTEIGDDVGYGPARYLTPEQVREVAAALRTKRRSQLEANFNPAAMKAADIYPALGEHPEDLEYVLTNYDELVTFYHRAADRGDGVVKYLN